MCLLQIGSGGETPSLREEHGRQPPYDSTADLHHGAARMGSRGRPSEPALRALHAGMPPHVLASVLRVVATIPTLADTPHNRAWFSSASTSPFVKTVIILWRCAQVVIATLVVGLIIMAGACVRLVCRTHNYFCCNYVADSTALSTVVCDCRCLVLRVCLRPSCCALKLPACFGVHRRLGRTGLRVCRLNLPC